MFGILCSQLGRRLRLKKAWERRIKMATVASTAVQRVDKFRSNEESRSCCTLSFRLQQRCCCDLSRKYPASAAKHCNASPSHTVKQKTPSLGAPFETLHCHGGDTESTIRLSLRLSAFAISPSPETRRGGERRALCRRLSGRVA